MNTKRALPHLYPGAARWTVRPNFPDPDTNDGDVAAGLFFSEHDARLYGEREWPQEARTLGLQVVELVFPDPYVAAVTGAPGPLLYAGPTTDAALADAPPNPQDWSN